MGTGHDLRPATGPSMVLILRPIRVQHVLLIRLRIPGIILIIIIITRGLQSTTGPCLSISCYSLPSPSRATLSTTITVIQSPARLASEDNSSMQVCWARQRLPTQLQVTGKTLHWLPTRQRMTTRQGLPTRQNVMTRQLPTRQGVGRPSRTEGSSSDDSSKVPDSSSAMT